MDPAFPVARILRAKGSNDYSATIFEDPQERCRKDREKNGKSPPRCGDDQWLGMIWLASDHLIKRWKLFTR